MENGNGNQKREAGWEMQERSDAEMASDLSRDRNCLDFVAYNPNGKPFLTLAGIMKVANEEKFTVDSVKTDAVTLGDADYIRTVTCVSLPPDDTGHVRKAWGMRDEAVLIRNTAKPNQHASIISLNIAIKAACKTLLYGHVKFEELIEDFTDKNEFGLKPREEPQSAPQQNTPVTATTASKMMDEKASPEDIEEARKIFVGSKCQQFLSDNKLNPLDAIFEKYKVEKSEDMTKAQVLDWIGLITACNSEAGGLWEWIEKKDPKVVETEAK